jgi:hypothetical protein
MLWPFVLSEIWSSKDSAMHFPFANLFGFVPNASALGCVIQSVAPQTVGGRR